ncbi:hypothetical protein PCANB_000859 [Pneumocystis canis]|nr:hypothetical protein PCANB_000859 [Pneumocystis canis]
MSCSENDLILNKEENYGSRMWDRIISATGAISKAMADKYVAIVKEDDDRNIDNEDQSKVSRVLRDYYMHKCGCLPEWLDSRTFEASNIKSSENVLGHHFSSNFCVTENTRVTPISFRDIYDSMPNRFESLVKPDVINSDESQHRISSVSERLREKLLIRRNADYN